MSDDDWSYRKFRAVLVCGLIFGGLFVYSLFDIVFLALAREGTATVKEVYELPGSRGRPPNRMMEFALKEADGSERIGKTRLGDEPPPEVGEQIEIQYLPRWLLDAPDALRPKRPFNWINFGLLVLAGGGFAFFTYRAIRAPAEPTTLPSRRRR